MATIRKKVAKDGTVSYEISVSRGRGKSRPTTQWYPPKNWSKKAIDRELAKVAAEYEHAVKAGEIGTREERKEQERHAALLEAQIQTFRQYCEMVFMPDLTARCSENTRSSYQGNLDNWIYPAIGDIKMPTISPMQIEMLFTSMQRKKLANSTIIKIYTILSSIWRKAYRTGVIERNPMDRVERPKPRKEEKRKKEPDTCSLEEVKYIWDCLEQESLMWRTLIHLLIDTGMRRGECCGLMWKNIDFKTGTITICQTVNYTVAKGVYVDTTKNGKTWTVDVAPYVLDLLRQLRLEQGRTTGFSQFVFTKHNSTDPMHPQSPTGHLRKFEEKYGIKGLHPHKLRHSFASIAITSGADVASVSEILGHSDKAVTLRMYTHADEASKKRASNIFRNALNNTTPDYAKNA